MSVKKNSVLILFIYCSLCFLTYSPIHFSVIHETKGPLSNPLSSVPAPDGSNQCPLCNFGQMVLFLEIAALFHSIFTIVGHFNLVEKYIIPHQFFDNFYSALAPPV
ncbi:MAG: hypothetical protein PHX78_04330 [bacterium]|nr:hypothetical protein [bacterium]